MSADALIVETSHLYKTYRGTVETPVLFDVNLRIHAGEFVAVMGQSGSGKSTLLNILGCLDRPSRGIVHIDGQDIAHLSDDGLARLRRERIGFIFQAHFLLDEFTCLENVLMPVLIRYGAIPVRERDRAIALLTRVGLAKELYKTPDAMSGGQNQRIAIVRALANRPSLLLADEPTGNLDSRNGKEVFALMREIGEETGVAVVMVTHDDRLAYEAQRILVIEDGYVRALDPALLSASKETGRGGADASPKRTR
jgi:ABC-type lipoprotein export system ATPase subunit